MQFFHQPKTSGSVTSRVHNVLLVTYIEPSLSMRTLKESIAMLLKCEKVRSGVNCMQWLLQWALNYK